MYYRTITRSLQQPGQNLRGYHFRVVNDNSGAILSRFESGCDPNGAPLIVQFSVPADGGQYRIEAITLHVNCWAEYNGPERRYLDCPLWVACPVFTSPAPAMVDDPASTEENPLPQIVDPMEFARGDIPLTAEPIQYANQFSLPEPKPFDCAPAVAGWL